MPEIPRDPRQLACDILSGKVKLEDLARERQIRSPQPPRPIPPAPPMRQPMPARPPIRQIPTARPTSAPFPKRRTPIPPPPSSRSPQPPPPSALPRPALAPLAPIQAEYEQPQDVPAKPARPRGRSLSVRELVGSRQSLRQGILLSEVLGKPVAMRDDW